MENEDEIYPNLMYPRYVLEAVDTGQWIVVYGKLVDPLTYMNRFGRNWLGRGIRPILRYPEEVIREIESMPLTEMQQKKLEAFRDRVRKYRSLNLDYLIKKAVVDNQYPTGLDRNFNGSL